jgi:hypothetical protein
MSDKGEGHVVETCKYRRAIISVGSMLLGSPTATAQAEDNLIDL